MCDIISLDIYHSEGDILNGQSGINFLLAALEISDNKPVALSECSVLPSPDNMGMDNARWSFCATWTGDYSCGGKYMPLTDWVQFYNSTAVITKDKIEYNR